MASTPPILDRSSLHTAWRQLRVVLAVAFVLSLLFRPVWTAGWPLLWLRLTLVGLFALGAFALIARWPSRLPKWLQRWALQVIGVALVIPIAVALAYALTTLGETGHWWQVKGRLDGYGMLFAIGLVVAPWVAFAALLQQVRGEAQQQALAFELERSRYERQALDARLRQLQSQVEPHFLFNTLANVRELVDSGSPHASAVLASLIAYLRAAVPRLHGGASTLGQELELVRAYLEVMHMRMPDRLQFTVHGDDAVLPMRCPPTTLLTLVENAVRHGIDPSEEGGRIEVRVRLREGRVLAEVIDTGVGLRSAPGGLGTGLSNLRERLQLAFNGDALLRLQAMQPRGASAELEFPAQREFS